MRQRGDTIIEVLFAVTVFSLVAVGGLSLMNQGTAMAQRSLEISLVRDQIDSQADALRYMHNAYVANFDQPSSPSTVVWNKITSPPLVVTKAQDFSSISGQQQCLPIPLANMFALDITKLDGNNRDDPVIMPLNITTTPATYAQLRYPPKGQIGTIKSDGMWIEAVHTAKVDKAPGYYDFHIRACWLSPGQSAPVTLGTIVRLYDPS